MPFKRWFKDKYAGSSPVWTTDAPVLSITLYEVTWRYGRYSQVDETKAFLLHCSVGPDGRVQCPGVRRWEKSIYCREITAATTWTKSDNEATLSVRLYLYRFIICLFKETLLWEYEKTVAWKKPLKNKYNSIIQRQKKNACVPALLKHSIPPERRICGVSNKTPQKWYGIPLHWLKKIIIALLLKRKENSNWNYK